MTSKATYGTWGKERDNLETLNGYNDAIIDLVGGWVSALAAIALLAFSCYLVYANDWSADKAMPLLIASLLPCVTGHQAYKKTVKTRAMLQAVAGLAEVHSQNYSLSIPDVAKSAEAKIEGAIAVAKDVAVGAEAKLKDAADAVLELGKRVETRIAGMIPATKTDLNEIVETVEAEAEKLHSHLDGIHGFSGVAVKKPSKKPSSK